MKFVKKFDKDSDEFVCEQIASHSFDNPTVEKHVHSVVNKGINSNLLLSFSFSTFISFQVFHCFIVESVR